MTEDVGVEQLIDIGGDDSPEAVTNNEGSELDKIKEELRNTKGKLNDALSEVAVAQILQENLCSVERQKVALEEELATMQILLSEATQDSQSNVIDHLKKKYCDLKAENQDLKIQLNLFENSSGGTPSGQLSSSAAAAAGAAGKKNFTTDTESQTSFLHG